MNILDILLNKIEKDNKLIEEDKTKSSDVTGDNSLFNSTDKTFEEDLRKRKYIIITVVAVIIVLIIGGGLLWKFLSNS